MSKGLPLSLYCGCFEEERNACRVIMNRFSFFLFKMHLHTEYTAKANLILESSGKIPYFQVYLSAKRQDPDSAVPRWVSAVSEAGLCSEMQHRQVDNCWKKEV